MEGWFCYQILTQIAKNNETHPAFKNRSDTRKINYHRWKTNIQRFREKKFSANVDVCDITVANQEYL